MTRVRHFAASMVASILSAGEVGIQVLQPPIPSGLFAGMAMMVTLGSGIAHYLADRR